jgi:hypothetical protein
MDMFSPFLLSASHAGEGTTEDLPLRKSKTPPPTRPSVLSRTRSSTSLTSDPEDFGVSARSSTEKTVVEDPSSRVKRVENWRRRLARARERLLLSEGQVEIWTWRVGGDVEHICESLVVKAMERKKQGGVMSKAMGVHRENQIYTQ